jgi:SAM-dependent methyltransferase
MRNRISRVLRGILGEEAYSRMRLYTLQLRRNRRTFTEIYEQNLWKSGESFSGQGSTFGATTAIRDALPALFTKLGIRSLLDAGCGDFNWMKSTDLGSIEYLGVDVVEPLIRRNRERYASTTRRFMMADIARDLLPRADLVLCKECLIHLPNRQVCDALRNFKRSGASYLLTTTFPNLRANRDTWPGSFRPLNLQIAPFKLPPPREIVDDGRDTSESTAVLGLWSLDDL